jgi:hypothetical protein
MAQKVTYWVTTGLLAALSVFAAFVYLSGSAQAVEGQTAGRDHPHGPGFGQT